MSIPAFLYTKELAHINKQNCCIFLNNKGVLQLSDSEKEIKLAGKSKKLSAVAKSLSTCFKSGINQLNEQQRGILLNNLNLINKKISIHNRNWKNTFFGKILSVFGIGVIKQIDLKPALESLKDKEGFIPVSKMCAADVGLSPCKDGDEILNKTEFLEHEDPNDRLTPDFIKKCDLAPCYEMTFKGTTFYLSKIFTPHDLSPLERPNTVFQEAALAYVKEGDKFVPRVLYRSGVGNTWRVMPVTKKMMMGDVNIGKGIEKQFFPQQPSNPIRASTNLPFEIRLALNWLTEAENGKNYIQPTKSVKFTPKKLNHVLPAKHSNIKRNDLNHVFKNIAKKAKGKENANTTEEFTNAHVYREVLDLSDPHTLSRALMPDYTNVERFQMKGTNSDTVDVYRVLSKNKQYEYIFYNAKSFCYDPSKSHDPYLTEDGSTFERIWWKEKDRHPWLASVAYIGPDQKLTSFLTYAQFVDPHTSDTPGADYLDYLPFKYQEDRSSLVQKGENNHLEYAYKIDGTKPQDKGIHVIPSENKIPNTYVVPTWQYRKDFAIIKSFEGFLNSQKT